VAWPCCHDVEVPNDSDLPPAFAMGGTAELHDLGSGWVLKRFASWVPEAVVRREARLTSIAHGLGLPVPQIGDVGMVAGRLSFRLSRVDGRVLHEHLFEHPDEVSAIAERFASLHAAIHDARHDQLDEGRPRHRARIEQNATLDPATKSAVLRRLDELNDGRALCHGDFHAGNVMRTDADALVAIDWGAAHAGAPAADVAQTIVAMTEWLSMDVPGHWRHVTADLIDSYTAAYRNLRPDVVADVEHWRPVVAAIRLAAPHPPTSDEPLRRMAEAVRHGRHD
jgi:tRNA A-37 threonylcarbamoyl transferase component Bud32